MATTNGVLKTKIEMLQMALALSKEQLAEAHRECTLKNSENEHLYGEIERLETELNSGITLRNWLKLLPLAVRQSFKR